MRTAPVRFSPAVEHKGPDEQKVIGELEEQFDSIQETMHKDCGHAMRPRNAAERSNGCPMDEPQALAEVP